MKIYLPAPSPMSISQTYAKFQTFAEIMVEKPYQVITPEYDTFQWTIGDIQYYGRNASIMTMPLCIR